MSQLSYAFYESQPFAGVLGDYRSDYDIQSYVNDEVSAGMPFGIAVAKGATSDQSAILLVDGNSKVIGLTVHDHAREPFYLSGVSPAAAGIAPGWTLGVLRKGRMWVVPEVAVTAEDPLYARHTANGGLTQKGALRNDNDGGNALQIAQGVWKSTVAAGAPALVDVNLP